MRRQGSIARALRRFGREEDGANLVEFSIVVLLFLFLLFAIIDFGRMANAWVGANKATQVAARIAAVRPPACAGVPRTNQRGALTTPAFGTLCRFGGGTCADPGPVECGGDAANATAAEVFAAVRPLLPPGTAIGNLRFRYTHDPDLGFLGGPYVPMVTVELQNVEFTYVSQLGIIIEAMTGDASDLGTNLAIPPMSVSLPGEDLALGTEG
jgi:Flp pilus assembly pilin Flp